MALEVTTSSLAERLHARIRLRTAKIGVLGLGHVGLPLASAFAEVGYSVLGVDVDPDKVKQLNTGKSYLAAFSEEKLAALGAEGLFEATTQASALEETDAILICVPTPLTDAREPDLSFLVEAGRLSARHSHPTARGLHRGLARRAADARS